MRKIIILSFLFTLINWQAFAQDEPATSNNVTTQTVTTPPKSPPPIDTFKTVNEWKDKIQGLMTTPNTRIEPNYNPPKQPATDSNSTQAGSASPQEDKTSIQPLPAPGGQTPATTAPAATSTPTTPPATTPTAPAAPVVNNPQALPAPAAAPSIPATQSPTTSTQKPETNPQTAAPAALEPTNTDKPGNISVKPPKSNIDEKAGDDAEQDYKERIDKDKSDRAKRLQKILSLDYRSNNMPEEIYKDKYGRANAHLASPIYSSDYAKMALNEINNPSTDMNNLRAFLDHYKSPDSIHDDNGNSLLMQSVANNRLSETRLILARKANPNRANNNGITPLEVADYNENISTERALITMGAGSEELEDFDPKLEKAPTVAPHPITPNKKPKKTKKVKIQE